MDKVPQTQDALLQHVQRAVCQAGMWTTSTQVQAADSISKRYFSVQGSIVIMMWVPVWITIPEVSIACSELILAKENVQDENVEKSTWPAHHFVIVNATNAQVEINTQVEMNKLHASIYILQSLYKNYVAIL